MTNSVRQERQLCWSAERYRAKPRMSLAHRIVNRAVRRGEMRPAYEYQCADCDARAIEYDHRDYLKPLVVDPVCRRCNVRRGPGLNP